MPLSLSVKKGHKVKIDDVELEFRKNPKGGGLRMTVHASKNKKIDHYISLNGEYLTRKQFKEEKAKNEKIENCDD